MNGYVSVCVAAELHVSWFFAFAFGKGAGIMYGSALNARSDG